jgi:putative oxidoreductase
MILENHQDFERELQIEYLAARELFGEESVRSAQTTRPSPSSFDQDCWRQRLMIFWASWTMPRVRWNNKMRTASQIARYLLGFIFLVFGLNGFFHFLHMPGPTGVAAQFLGAIFASHFYVVIFFLHIVPAVFLLANRYVPLALTILGPIIFNIVCIHIFMIRGELPLAILVAVLWLVVAYSVRSAFSGIFRDGAALFAQEVETKSAKAQIAEKAKATEMLEDDPFSSDPGSTSAQWRNSR